MYGGSEMKISDFISQGSENGVGLRDLVNMTGWPERVVRAEIHRERLNGVPILSDNASGYFFPSSERDKAQCVRSLRHRAKEIGRVADAIEKAGKGYNG